MAMEAEVVYVVTGTDQQEGLATLEWALKKWSSHSISIVIIHADDTKSEDFVYTPVGKLPASYVSDEKLKALRKGKEEENEKLLSEYKAFCGQVKAEALKIEKYDEPLHKVLVKLISGIRITKLVMGFSLTKPSCGKKSRAAISGLVYLYRHKPNFCELFVISGGKLLSLREENNEGLFIEDDQGASIGKSREKGSFRGWLGKILPEIATSQKNLRPSSSTNDDDSPEKWEIYAHEIETYFNQLLSSNSDEEAAEVENDTSCNCPAGEPVDFPENMSAEDRIETTRVKLREAQEMIRQKREEAKTNIGRHAKAEWAISLCTTRYEVLKARRNEESASRVDLNKELDAVKVAVREVESEVEEKKRKLESILELQSELSKKLHLSSLAKSRAEAQQEKVAAETAEIVRQVKGLSRQRDVVQRRIEFCKEGDHVSSSDELEFIYKEFKAEEIRAATRDFSEGSRLKSPGDWTNVYRGRIGQTTVAIKMYNSANGPSQEAFQAKVKKLSHIRHPHIVAMFGFCSELKCIAFEYMHNGCLRDALFGSARTTSTCCTKRGLSWHARIRIASEVSLGLSFLHSARPRPIAHGNLKPSKILLDRNLVAKIDDFRADWCHDPSDLQSDIRAFGNLLLQLLAGRSWAGLAEEAAVMDRRALVEALDEMAGEWPLDLAVKLAGIATRCLSVEKETDEELTTATVWKDIERVRKKADDLVATGECKLSIDKGSGDAEDLSNNVPRVFICPMLLEVMRNPHVAADGITYELKAIDEWLIEHGESPVTKSKLDHKRLTPNLVLRSLIHDWHNKRSIPLPLS